MLMERTKRKVLQFNLDEADELANYNKLLQDPSIKVIDKQMVPKEKSHFEKDYSTKETNHVVIVEVEECLL